MGIYFRVGYKGRGRGGGDGDGGYIGVWFIISI